MGVLPLLGAPQGAFYENLKMTLNWLLLSKHLADGAEIWCGASLQLVHLVVQMGALPLFGAPQGGIL